ncbi:hypothetical protein D9757_005409 [Collybiopsis confluens]|uniref:Uncharacterized protein n=1 Tax=Collybiopsis confluens TaxID=2823264 RepID=A0A8H5HLC6_9AGAR|nr:hypothetical protein D9757_005409 [Collybiopsis confluens]
MPPATSAFISPSHFEYIGRNKWRCTLCRRKEMSLGDAVGHELECEEHGVPASAEHAPAWDDAGTSAEAWLSPGPIAAAHQVHDIVPFWIRGIEAAERGQVLRFEDFLNTFQADPDPWPPRRFTAWAQADRHSHYGRHFVNSGHPLWDAEARNWASPPSTGTGKRTSNQSMMPAPHSLVELIASQNALSENRKKEMHSFIELSTAEKIKKIDGLICSLRSSQI